MAEVENSRLRENIVLQINPLANKNKMKFNNAQTSKGERQWIHIAAY